jgi:hypothetical protein
LLSIPVRGGRPKRVYASPLPAGVVAVDEWRSVVVIGTTASPVSSDGTWVRRGTGTWHRVSNDSASQIVVRGQRVVISAPTAGAGTAIESLDLSHRSPARRLATSNTTADCRCTPSVSQISNPALDGDYAYWLELSEPFSVPSPVPPVLTIVCRVDLSEARPSVMRWQPPQTIGSFAVTQGSVSATAASWYGAEPGIFRATPAWEAAVTPLPLEEGPACSHT